MIRPLALSLAAGMALLTATLCGVAETFPVVHKEPITVHILGGKDGLPLAHLHVVLLGGYDQRDLHDQLYRAEVLTDAHGQARLPGQLANLPWLQVWVAKKSLCQDKPRGQSFSVELIRRDGLSAPNRCGTAMVEDAPGVFTVFVKGRGKNAVAEMSVASKEAQIPAPEAVATALPAVEVVTRKPAEAETHPHSTQIPAAAVALPTASVPAPKEAVLKPVEPKPVVTAAPAIASAPMATPATAPAAVPAPSAATPAPVLVAAKGPASDPAKAEAHRTIRRVAGRPVSHRARPILASCPVRRPTAKTASPAASEKQETSLMQATAPATATIAIHKPKPAAGVKQTTATSGESKAPLNQK